MLACPVKSLLFVTPDQLHALVFVFSPLHITTLLAYDSQDIFPRQGSLSMCFSITNDYLIYLYLASVHFNVMVMSGYSRFQEIGSDTYRIQC